MYSDFCNNINFCFYAHLQHLSSNVHQSFTDWLLSSATGFWDSVSFRRVIALLLSHWILLLCTTAWLPVHFSPILQRMVISCVAFASSGVCNSVSFDRVTALCFILHNIDSCAHLQLFYNWTYFRLMLSNEAYISIN